MEISDLPFVTPPDAGKKRVWWRVTPTDDYAADCDRGAEYAALLLEYLAAPVVDPGTLGMVAVDMGSEVNGLTVGFWCHIGIAAAAGRQHAVRVREWWHEQEIIYQAREASERSERARKAARARWAKARDG